LARWNRSARRRDRCRGDLAGVDPPGGVRGSATKVPTHLSNTGQQAQRWCVSAGRCAHRGANRWAIKKTFHTAKRETGLEHYQARHGYQQLRCGRDRTHSDSPGGRLPRKVATISVSHGDAFPSRFSVPASKQQTRNHGAYHPKGFHPQKRCITDHQALSNDHLHGSIEAIITEVATTGRLLR